MKSVSILLVFFVSICAFLFSSFSDKKINGNGFIVKEIRHVENFSKLKITGAIKARVRFGQAISVEVSTDENIQEHIILKNDGNQLVIYSKNHIRPTEGTKVNITVPVLEALYVSGASRVDLENMLQTDRLDINLSGASKLNGAIQVQSMKGEVSGASKLSFSGEALSTSFQVSGASRVIAERLTSDICRLDLSGASFIAIRAEEEISVNASGASKVKFHGQAQIQKMNTSGASHVSIER